MGSTVRDPMTDDVTLPTPDEVAAMRERHVREVVAVHESGPEAWCPECRVHWPCDTARLLTLVDWLRANAAAWVAAVDEIDQANRYARRVDYPLRREQHAHDLDRIRRAAAGEGL